MADKFETEDLPVVLAAIHKARESKKFCTLTVIIDQQGGLKSVELQEKSKIK